MNCIKTLFIVAVVMICVPSISHAQSFKKNLVARYLFNGDAKDVSKNNNDGAKIGGVEEAEDRFGSPCGALRFDGSTGYIRVPNSISLQSISSEITITAWLYLEQGAKYSNLQWITLICKSENPKETDNSPQYRVQSTKKTLSVRTYKNNILKRDHDFGYNRWFFYAVTFNGYYVKEYFNGDLISNHLYAATLEENDEALNIGRDRPGQEEFFPGRMDDLRIYNTVLSEQDIRSIYKDNSEKKSKKKCDKKPQVEIVDITPKIGECYNQDKRSLYDVELEVEYENPTEDGVLYLKVGDTEKIKTVDPRKDKVIFNLKGLSSDGELKEVDSYFISDKAASRYHDNSMYRSPLPCEEEVICSIENISFDVGDCYEKNGISYYDVELDVKHTHPVKKGTELMVSVGGQLLTIDKNYEKISCQGLIATGEKVDILAFHTQNPTCRYEKKQAYIAPQSCLSDTSTPCSIESVKYDLTDCYLDNGVSYYDVSLSVRNEHPVETGKELMVSIGGKLEVVTSNYEQVSVKKLVADGNTVDLKVFYADNPSCQFSKKRFFTAPTPCKPDVKPSCEILFLDYEMGDCVFNNGRSLFDMTIEIEVSNIKKEHKSIIVQVGDQEGRGTIQRNGKVRVKVKNITANGKSLTAIAYLEKDDKCVKIKRDYVTAPQACDNIKLGSVEVFKDIILRNPKIKILLYDHRKPDGDIVSVKLGDEWIVDRLEITKTPHEVTKKLERGKEYILLSKAWNTGKIPPNTLTLKIIDVHTGKEQVEVINSDNEVTRGIRLKVLK